jgi:diketogulonate reductase-like aldo/keto reductase
MPVSLSRRRLLGLGASAALSLAFRRAGAEPSGPAPMPQEGDRLLTRPIPRTGEALPAIGLGTYATFDRPPGARGPVASVLRRFAWLGGRVVDSSPMYGQAEAAVGEALGALGRPPVFLATKVWTQGKAAGQAQMARSAELLGARVDLMQIHNLVDWRTHLPVLREMKAAGAIRYLGVTHYALSAFDELERLIRTEALDFVQLPYSAAARQAERRLLPAAADHRVAVLVMRPFEEGGLLSRTRGRPLPPLAAELGATSFAQLFLKFILGHPAVTAPLPATANVAHLEDNLGAGRGRLPTAEECNRIAGLL